jgi:signal transduction histidine kinase
MAAGELHWTGAHCVFGRDVDHRLHDLVALELTDATFLANDTRWGAVSLVSGTKRLAQAVLDESFAREFAILDCCSAPFATNSVVGRVFILAPGPFTPGLLHLCDVVAARIGSELEQFALRASFSMAAVVRERVRLARDLHDGVLQDLAAARLMIKSLAGASPEKLKSDVDEIAGILVQQQQRIRSFVWTANPKPPPDWDFAAEFQTLVAILQQQWRCEIVAVLRPTNQVLAGNLGFQVLLIFGEAIANAVQHGRSRRIVVEIERKDQVLHMLIRDDGRGLSNRPGNETPAPFSLRQRIGDLDGKLSLISSTECLELKIELPIV